MFSVRECCDWNRLGYAETYMNVGEAMGEAMLGLINGDARP